MPSLRRSAPAVLFAALALLAAGCASTPRYAGRTASSRRAPRPAPVPASSPRRVQEEEDRSLIESILFGPQTDRMKKKRAAPRPSSETLNSRRPYWEQRKRETAPLGFEAKTGWYVSALWAFTQHSDNDFDGQQFLSGADTIALPEIDPGSGGGAALGYRFQNSAFEVSFLQTGHESEWLGTAFDVDYQSFNVDFLQYLSEGRFQPFLKLGVGFPQLTIQNGAISGALIDDAVLRDELAVRFGGGFAFFLTPQVSLGGSAVYRLLHEYTEAEGVAPQGPITGVDGSGFSFDLFLSYTL